MAEPTDYAYDIFISYPHEEKHRMWVNDIFLEQFASFLSEAMPVEPKIYVDRERNTPGITWTYMIKNALALSKVLIPIWSPTYFRQYWCRAECAIMHYREERLHFRNINNPHGLILPIILHDGEFFPPFTDEIDFLNCRDVNLVFEGYKETPQYYKLLERIRDWAPNVAQSIDRAPPWDGAWLSPEWLDDPIKTWEHDPRFQIRRKPFTVNLG